jgi:quinol monooxygenase YgiN
MLLHHSLAISNMKVIQHGYIVVPPELLVSICCALENHIQDTRSEVGCLVFDVKARQSQKNIFDVYEEFEDEAAFEFHQQRMKQSEWGRISSSFERHYTLQHSDT